MTTNPAHIPEPTPDPTNVTGPAEVSCTACWLMHPEGECDR